jgi:hypothetical protein
LVALAAVPAAAQVTSASTGSGGPGIPVVINSGGTVQPPSLPEGSGAISGVVTDGVTGQPVAGAIVSLSVASRATIARTAREMTDSHGRFLFTKLSAREDYQLIATMPGYFDSTYGQDSLRPANGKILLADGQWLSTAKLMLWKGASISGTVTDERNDPVVGVYVHVFAMVNVSGAKQLAAGPIATTDDRGMYRVANLGPGQYLVSVPSVAATVPASNDRLIDGGTPFAVFDPDSLSRLAFSKFPIPPPPQDNRRFAYPPTYAPSATSPAQATPVAIGIGDARTGVDVHLEPAVATSVSGRAEAAPEALNGLVLRLLPAGLESLGSGSETATSLVTSSGDFVFLSVPAGSYTVEVRREMTELLYSPGGNNARFPIPPGLGGGSGWSNGEVDSAPPGVQWNTSSGSGASTYLGRAAVTVAGAPVTGVVVPVRSGSRLSGVIVREQKNPKPPAGQQYFVPTLEPANGNPSQGIVRQRQRASPDEFLLEAIAPGLYVLRFTVSAGWRLKSVTLGGVDYTNRPIDTSNGQDIADVRAVFTDQVATLTGSVRTSNNNAADTAVIVFPAEPDQWTNYGYAPTRIKTARPAAQGTFQLTSLPEGEYTVIAVPSADVDKWQDPEYLKQAARAATHVSLKWGQTTNVDVTVVR